MLDAVFSLKLMADKGLFLNIKPRSGFGGEGVDFYFHF